MAPKPANDMVPAAPQPETRAPLPKVDPPQIKLGPVPDFEDEEEPAEEPVTSGNVAGHSSNIELEYLRQMLEEQKRATQQAIQSTAQLADQLNEARTELSTTKTEINKVKKQYAAGPKNSRTNMSNHAAEIASLRTNLYQAEQHLEREHKIREHEARQAKIKAQELEGELAAAQHSHEVSKPQSSPWRGWRRVATIAAVGAVIVGGTVVYLQQQTGSPLGAQSVNAAPAPAAPLAASVATPNDIPELAAIHRLRNAAPPPPPESANKADFGGAVDRLENALAAYPQPDAVLRAVYKNSKDCALVWNDGHPALLFGSEKGGATSLAATVSQCAHAVEQLH